VNKKWIFNALFYENSLCFEPLYAQS